MTDIFSAIAIGEAGKIGLTVAVDNIAACSQRQDIVALSPSSHRPATTLCQMAIETKSATDLPEADC
ncbi:hypothetical protein [Sphingopyxis sp. 22461]|uniref:hypothetical protein n=1 Tax=Sphingopyxis sp. 22461 TaxID=3453923 RepID=UPI003F864533